jgi:hypothetical protein
VEELKQLKSDIKSAHEEGVRQQVLYGGNVVEPEPGVETCNACTASGRETHSSDGAWEQNCDVIVIVAGANQADVVSFPNPLALHAACFALDLFAFCEDKIIALASSKRAKLLQDLSSKLQDTFKYKVEVLTRDKRSRRSSRR